MEAASIRILNSPTINRQLSHSIINRRSLKFPPKIQPIFSYPLQIPKTHFSPTAFNRRNLIPRSSTRIRSASFIVSSSSSSISLRNSNSLGFFLSFFASSLIFSSRVSEESFTGVVSDQKEKSFSWFRAPGGINGGDSRVLGERGPVFTVVLLGWLGVEQKHLKRYAQLYTSRGVHAITFVVPVREGLGFDLGRKVQKRISELADELISWVSGTEEDGRERFLIFHTFSNTGWLAYGEILDYFLCRSDLIEKVKGCVIDSGGDPEINTKVWAAGFSAALLKKRSSSTHPSVEVRERNGSESDKSVSKPQGKAPPLIEITLMSALKTFFSIILNLPDVNRKLTKIISTLTKNPPPCPQLYLYSTADNVIPFRSVEMFIQDQRRMGRKVWAYNFVSSPHVDHYRNFPHTYKEEIDKFLEECVTTKTRK